MPRQQVERFETAGKLGESEIYSAGMQFAKSC
jgi:hypothetical protein